jgi:hypothetical protein
MMTRREVLLASGSAAIAAGLGGCASTKVSRPWSRLDEVHDLMAEQVAQDQFKPVPMTSHGRTSGCGASARSR